MEPSDTDHTAREMLDEFCDKTTKRTNPKYTEPGKEPMGFPRGENNTKLV